MKVGTGEAPGKALLIGEHAVVYDQPAIAIPVRSVKARVQVRFSRNEGFDLIAPDLDEHVRAGEKPTKRLAPLLKLAEHVMTSFGENGQGLEIEIRSSIPSARGMGSGAAVSVALVRALCDMLGRSLHAEQICQMAGLAEKEYHGNPSGVDAAVVARDEPIYFVKSRGVRPIEIGPGTFHFVVADTGVDAATAEIVDDVRRGREQDRANFDSYFWEIGSLASVSREVLHSGSPAELGLCMNRAHAALRAIGVSCRELDKLVGVALENGAFGAKLSGAGRGGAMIALVDGEDEAERVGRELLGAGAEDIFTTVLGAS